ncbi:SDR family NAD(P)-dependent oxidoreductase [Neptunicella sp. SCSIO 80796]|uniref:SDR family NAD(P)-dependent oxidoreductase n=1 Tax=Neptunicella plasticusilytica TaxID=3117012 RepID=UPI003A4E049F
MKLQQMKNIWIVGASSGIGEALVKELDQPGRQLFISARRKPVLDEVAKQCQCSCLPLAMDMTDDDSLDNAVQQIGRVVPSLDMVVINAGTCEYLDASSLDIELVRRVMETNFFAILKVVKKALPLLKNSQVYHADATAQLVLMSSSITYQPLPRAGAYGASKSALRFFAECLQADLQHSDISLRLVSPGFVKTPLTAKNDFPMPFLISADEAAKRIVKGLGSSRFDIHFPYRLTLLLKAVALLPDGIRLKLVSRLSRQQESAG